MNPAFLILAAIALVFTWFCLAYVFEPLGKVIYRFARRAFDAIFNKNSKEDK